MASQAGLEPATNRLEGGYSYPTELLGQMWWAMGDSNPQSTNYEFAALTVKLMALSSHTNI